MTYRTPSGKPTGIKMSTLKIVSRSPRTMVWRRGGFDEGGDVHADIWVLGRKRIPEPDTIKDLILNVLQTGTWLNGTICQSS
jgi:hypothetical protein